MKKFIIVGLSGSGKSTLGRQIAEKLEIDFIELDSINHQKNWRPIGEDEFRARIDNIILGDGWVIDGNYFSKLGLSYWEKADAVIWLDRPLFVTLSRLIKRTLSRTITREELWNGNRESFIGNFFTNDSVIYFMLSKRKSQKRNTIASSLGNI